MAEFLTIEEFVQQNPSMALLVEIETWGLNPGTKLVAQLVASLEQNTPPGVKISVNWKTLRSELERLSS